MRARIAGAGVGVLIGAAAIFACSLRDTSYLQAGGGPPIEPDGGGPDAPANPDTGSGATRTATVVVSGQVAPQFLTQDDGTLYWTGDGKIFALKKDGSETTPREVTAAAGVTFLVAEQGSGPNLYFTAGKEVKSVPKAGGAATSIATTDPAPTALALDPTYVFAVVNDEDLLERGAVMRYLHDGSSPTAVRVPEDTSEVVAVALQGADVFWDEGAGDFFSLPKTTGPDAGPTKYSVSGQDIDYSYSPLAFAVDEKAIYYSNGTDVRAFAKTPTGTPTQLINYVQEAEVSAIAIDDTYVYAIDRRVNGTLRRNTKDGRGTPELMLDGLATPTSIAIDATTVYLTVQGPAGTIVKCPK